MGWETELADVVAGQPIEAAWGNTVRDKLVHIVATPAALPADEPDGGLAYANSNDGLYLRTNGVWVAVPRGVLFYGAQTTTSGATGATELELGTGAAAVTLPTGRRLKVTGRTQAAQSAAAGWAILGLRDLGVTISRLSSVQFSAAGGRASLHGSEYLTPTAGAHSYSMVISTTAGTVSSEGSVMGTVPGPSYLLVEDIGAV